MRGMRLALDTNRYADLQRGDPAVVHTLRHAAEIYLPLIVLGELRAGFLGGNRAAANEQILATFLSTPGVHVLAPDDETTRHYATLVNQLRQQATPIPTNDLWIAALVIQLQSRALHARRAFRSHLTTAPTVTRFK